MTKSIFLLLMHSVLVLTWLIILLNKKKYQRAENKEFNLSHLIKEVYTGQWYNFLYYIGSAGVLNYFIIEGSESFYLSIAISVVIAIVAKMLIELLIYKVIKKENIARVETE
ncbi:MAG: hypothetical protein ACEPOV_04065 [Hyphomicrobiales bacterium]